MPPLADPSGLDPTTAPPPESIWRAPLVPPALAFTAGVALDRFAQLPVVFAYLLGGSCLVAFAVVRLGGPARLGLLYLLLAGAAFGSAYHHYRHTLFAEDDIGRHVGDRAEDVRLVGVVDEEPRRLPGGRPQPLRTQPEGPSATTIVTARRLATPRGEEAVSGRVRVIVHGDIRDPQKRLLPDLHAGDEVELRGRLLPLSTRGNPGEFDQAAFWHARGVHALLTLQADRGGVRRLAVGWPWSPAGWLGVARGAAHDILDATLPDAAVARALLLGEGHPMTTDDWGKYVRTGVVHVLAISGQHLVVLAWLLWHALRLGGVRQRHAAVIVALVLLAYALLTGGRPSALRAAVVAGVYCVGLMLGRPALKANLLALAWLVVGLLQPADLFDQGCQLSFAAVVVLWWAVPWLLAREVDPIDRLVDAARPPWLRGLRAVGFAVYESYAISFIVWAAISPLVAFHTGLVSPLAVVLGPPLTLLTSVALFAGLLLILVAPWSSQLASIPACVVGWSLGACEFLVDLAERWPAHLYVGEVPAWWACGFYLGLVAVLTHAALRRQWRWAAPVGLAWGCLLLVLGSPSHAPNELRCTFLAVGHGGAIVLELPDGRTLLYDAGSLRGPDVGSRSIAPFLWAQGIRRLDEVILSHADLDHFNGLVDLTDRFAIGRVLTSDSFENRNNAAVRRTLAELDRRGIPRDVLHAGDRLHAVGVTIEVLHPPAGFTGSNENTRSLVLQVRHADHSILLTGDLEREGLVEMLRLPPRPIDVLLAPHHGSASVDGPALVRWCQPGLVVSSQGPPRGRQDPEARYAGPDVVFWTTQARGAITVRSTPRELTAEGYRDGKHWRR